MRIEFLGTGGAIPTPRPCCNCRICAEARSKGIPYSRNGPSIFVHGPNLLIDTPEDIVHSLNRANIQRIDAVTYSHWHPDHTAGLRVFEPLNADLWAWPPDHRRTPVYIPQGVETDFVESKRGIDVAFDYLQNRLGIVDQRVIADGEPFTLNGVTVEAHKLPAPDVNAYAFILTEGKKRVFIAPDELDRWEPDESLGHFDLAILPSGVFEFDPFTEERRISEEHPVLKTEATFRQTLEMVRQLNADKVIFTHIGEMDGNSFDDLTRLQGRLKEDFRGTEKSLMFAFDRLAIGV